MATVASILIVFRVLLATGVAPLAVPPLVVAVLLPLLVNCVLAAATMRRRRHR